MVNSAFCLRASHTLPESCDAESGVTRTESAKGPSHGSASRLADASHPNSPGDTAVHREPFNSGKRTGLTSNGAISARGRPMTAPAGPRKVIGLAANLNLTRKLELELELPGPLCSSPGPRQWHWPGTLTYCSS
eukprot:1648046-Rhodomonas_salina.3